MSDLPEHPSLLNCTPMSAWKDDIPSINLPVSPSRGYIEEFDNIYRKRVEGMANEIKSSKLYIAGQMLKEQFPELNTTVGGVKFDQDKPRMDLLDTGFLEDVASVLGFGAKKYAAHNWRNGISYSRLIGAAMRHLGAINRGEDLDPESGLPHTAHLGCCIMFLNWMMKERTDLDDRWKK